MGCRRAEYSATVSSLQTRGRYMFTTSKPPGLFDTHPPLRPTRFTIFSNVQRAANLRVMIWRYSEQVCVIEGGMVMH
jgi:hypothetical protein